MFLQFVFLCFLRFQTGTSFSLRHQPNRPLSLPLLHHTSVKNIEFGSICKGGSDPDRPNKVNQDACFIHHVSLGMKNITFMGVFDGHGKKGHVINEFFSQRLPKILEEKYTFYFTNDDGKDGRRMESGEAIILADMEHFFVESFEEVNEEARLNTEIPAGRSGTTCIVSMIDLESGQIYTANVGDSRAILGIQRANDKHDNDAIWTIEPLSDETTTKRDGERSRIEAAEGRIDSQGNVWYGPIGIAMTRSLGNIFMKRAGVIATPEVKVFDLNEYYDEKCTILITLGTDGIFDVMSNHDTINFIEDKYQEEQNLQASIVAIVDEAADRWRAGLPMDVRIDDMTCISARIQFDS